MAMNGSLFGNGHSHGFEFDDGHGSEFCHPKVKVHGHGSDIVIGIYESQRLIKEVPGHGLKSL